MLALDIGNVLCDIDLRPFVNKMVAFTGLDNNQIIDWICSIQSGHDIGHNNIHREFKSKFYLEPYQIESVMWSWQEVLKPNLYSIERVKNLITTNGIDVALLSNMGTEHRSTIDQHLSEIFYFCKHHISCDIGARKPQKIYFQSFLMENPSFSGSVYVDDRQENLEAGERAGFRTVHLDTSQHDRSTLKQKWDHIESMILT